MRKGISARQFAFLVPLFLLISLFAIYPIVCSVVYTLFDYRTNDQTVAGLYTGSSLNASLFVEDCDYVIYYLEDDITQVGPEDQAVLQQVMDDMQAMMSHYGDTEGVIDLGASQKDELNAFLDAAETRINSAYDNNPEVEFYNGQEKLGLILGEMRSCLIKSNFTGFENYGKLLRDTRFFHSLDSTLIFTVISVFCELVLGMCLALIMNKAIRGIGIVRTTSLIPWAIPTAVSALMWSYMYDGSSGIIARIFTGLGFIQSPEMMLLSAKGAMTAAILADVWKTTPYMALLLLAGLQTIDRGLYESATVDGAGPARTFWSVTLPLLKPSILVALLFRTLDAFRVYDLIAILTGGSQGTETLSIYAYKIMIGQNNYGYGSAIVLAMVLCVAVIAFLFVKVLGAELVADD